MIKYLSGFLLLAGAGIVHATNVYNITASAGLMLDNNLTRAQYERDIYDDRAWFAGISADYNVPVDESSKLQLTGTFETIQYGDANLGNDIFSLQAGYIFQPHRGYTAPWYSLFLLYGINSHDSEYRDGSFSELGITMGKRLTDATTLRAGISRQRTSAEDEVFSLNTSRVYGNLDFKFGQNTAYTTLAYSTGDIVATVGRQNSGSEYPLSLSGMDHTGDDAFPWLDNPWAYKLDADTWSLRLGYVYALAGNQSIDANLLHYQSSAYGGNDYDGMITTITYFYRF